MIEANVVCDSLGPTTHHPRLMTMFWRYPKFVHQESLRHRKLYFEDGLRGDFDFSFSVSSARAIPFARMLAEVRSDTLRAEPVKWGAEQKGMSPGDRLAAVEEAEAKRVWRLAAHDAAHHAETLMDLGVHKSIINRVIEPYVHVNCIVTGAAPGWMNFFGLRLDAAADPTLRALAEAAWKEWNESQPWTLHKDEWHLPLVRDEELASLMDMSEALRISVARCARTSYTSFTTNTMSTREEDLALYDKLVGSTPIHASPAEHQAIPDMGINNGIEWRWLRPALSGNLGPGWIQYRKLLPFEAIASLPAGR